MLFSEILATLPAIDGIAAIELLDAQAQLQARLDNKPGTAGSVRVYHALLQQYGELNQAAASAGLALYAEHTADARKFPGKHPNIDRLLAIAEQQAATLTLHVVRDSE